MIIDKDYQLAKLRRIILYLDGIGDHESANLVAQIWLDL
jgi:hypothetical protein